MKRWLTRTHMQSGCAVDGLEVYGRRSDIGNIKGIAGRARCCWKAIGHPIRVHSRCVKIVKEERGLSRQGHRQREQHGSQRANRAEWFRASRGIFHSRALNYTAKWRMTRSPCLDCNGGGFGLSIRFRQVVKSSVRNGSGEQSVQRRFCHSSRKIWSTCSANVAVAGDRYAIRSAAFDRIVRENTDEKTQAHEQNQANGDESKTPLECRDFTRRCQSTSRPGKP